MLVLQLCLAASSTLGGAVVAALRPQRLVPLLQLVSTSPPLFVAEVQAIAGVSGNVRNLREWYILSAQFY